ncbi:MAG: hypothetical protein RR622_08445 [Hydrogenoanaerobacterium sp.]
MNREELLQKAKPILFNTAMVKAILNGKKSCTRRVIKLKYVEHALNDPVRVERPNISDNTCIRYLCTAPYQVGDILWVRETWSDPSGEGYPYWYKADFPLHRAADEVEIGIPVDLVANDYIWSPSIHMPKDAARLFLRVTDIHTERLCDIDHATKISAEGVDIGEHCRQCIKNYGYPCCSDVDEDNGTECGLLDDIRSNFADLWDSTVKKQDIDRYGWKANQWVWVIEFERVEAEESEDKNE